MEIKKYCLLDNGEIHSCYFSNGELRQITKIKGKWYLMYDKSCKNVIANIVKFSDDYQELEKVVGGKKHAD